MARTWHYFPFHLEGEIFDLSPFKTFVGDYHALLRIAPEVANQDSTLLSRFSSGNLRYGTGVTNFLFVPGQYPAPPNTSPIGAGGYRYYHTSFKDQGMFNPESTTGVWISFYDLGAIFGEPARQTYDSLCFNVKSKRDAERAAKKKASEERRAAKLGLTFENFKTQQKAQHDEQTAKRRAARMLSKFMVHTSELGRIKSELEQAIKTLGEQRYNTAQSDQMLYTGRRLQSLSKMLRQFATDYVPRKRRRY